MYGPLWRLLPGPLPLKILVSAVLVAGVVAICFLWLFPAIAPHLPFNDNSVQTGLQAPGSAPSPHDLSLMTSASRQLQPEQPELARWFRG